MVSVLLVSTALLALGADSSVPGSPGPADRAAYEAAKSRVGRDPDSHVRLALWCEAHGLTAERIKHLARAVLSDPTHATARGLLGLVPFKGQWKTPDAVTARVNEDEARGAAMAKYTERRARMANTADAHWKLALWCQDQGLEPEARAHLAMTVQLDPGRDAAWKRLGYKKVKGRWITEEQLAAENAEAEGQKAADKHYRPLLAKWRAWLSEKNPARRSQAAEGLAALTDPRAVPALWLTFASGNAAQQELAVGVLGQIDSPGSSRALAMLAVGSNSADVRGKATGTLRGRDPRDFVGLLIGLLRDPVKYEVRPWADRARPALSSSTESSSTSSTSTARRRCPTSRSSRANRSPTTPPACPWSPGSSGSRARSGPKTPSSRGVSTSGCPRPATRTWRS
ncbi:MAG: HEAT repeat domain-containing protein [Isosphaeraceae bacterium]